MDRRGEEDPRRQRTQVFERTKMCKFFILNCCSRGDSCHFAHDKTDLQALPNLYRTKLCKTLINTGSCTDPECRYAHTKEELRVVMGFTGVGQIGSQGSSMELPPPPTMNEKEASTQLFRGGNNGRAAAGAAIPGQAEQLAALQRYAEAQNAQKLDSFVTTQAVLQMGQAAQAHMTEAVRLQAMVAALQAQGAAGLVQGQIQATQSGALAFAAAGTLPKGVQMPTGVDATAYGGFVPAHFVMPNPHALTGPGGSPLGLFPGNDSKVESAVRTGPSQHGAPGRGKARGGNVAAGVVGQRQRGAGQQGQANVNAPATQMVATGVVVKNTFLDYQDQTDAPVSMNRLRPVKTAGGRLVSLGGNEQLEDPDDVAGAQDSFVPSEPAQIKLGSLRSLSSHSLPIEPDDPFGASPASGQNISSAHLVMGRPTAAPLRSPALQETIGRKADAEDTTSAAPCWQVKNTFIDFEAAQKPRLRPVMSAAEPLNRMAEGAEREVEDLRRLGGLKLDCRPPVSIHESSHWGMEAVPEKVVDHAPLAAGLRWNEDDSSRTLEGSASPGRAVGTPWVQAPAGLPTLAEPLMPGAAMTVKNTFLEFPTEERPQAALRSVHTFAGRLDLLGGQD